MQGGPTTDAGTPTGAVFLSYASEDVVAAERIFTALRAASIETWFDQSELRGGDAWDRRIREQIHDCRLFVEVVSAHTEGRDEGYFRREWKLAVDRTHEAIFRSLGASVAFVPRAGSLPIQIEGYLKERERGDSSRAYHCYPERYRICVFVNCTAGLQWQRARMGMVDDVSAT